jgi:molybdopterin-guanine dinucleotide biosynthesis protein A
MPIVMRESGNYKQTGRLLGAVLAGGLSTRFGSDKALALLDGRRLIDHAVAALTTECDAVIVVGREDSGHPSAPDWPHPQMGPLGGLAGALRHALSEGYDAVLSCGVDSLDLPADLATLLSPAPACLMVQPIIGLWPAKAASMLEEILLNTQNHSVRHFAECIGARSITAPADPLNVNTRLDLERIKARKV